MTATGQSICIIKEITWPIPSKYSFGAEKIMLSMYGVISMSISTKLRKWEERYIKNILLEPSEQNMIF